MKPRIVRVAFAASALLISSAVSQAALQLLQFEPTPATPDMPEFAWTGPGGNFVTGQGTLGNGGGDGNLPPELQQPGGLEVDMPTISIPGIAGSVSTNGGLGTTFYDVTYKLSSGTNYSAGGDLTTLRDTGATEEFPPLSTTPQVTQNLSDGTFEMDATDGTVLLTGTLTNNSFSFANIPGSTAVGVQHVIVNYTGGAILPYLGGNDTGSASISMTTTDGTPTVTDLGSAYSGLPAGIIDNVLVNGFTANATGVFDYVVVPEPASIGLVAALGMLSLRRRR